MKKILLKLENLSFSYAENLVPIFESLNLELYAGEILWICGKSGCGKSTFMHIINGIIPHIKKGKLTGNILFRQEPILEKTVSQRAKFIGSVFQNAGEQIVFDKVKDELLFPLENFNMSKTYMDAFLQTFIKEYAISLEAKTANLSGGEKQQILEASVLAMEQKIFLLDEPLANLDKTQALKLLHKLRYLADQKKCGIIVIEHRKDLMQKYYDRIFDFDYFKIFEKQKVPAAKTEQLAMEFKVSPIKNDKAHRLLQIQNLNYQIQNRTILENINLNLYQGEHLFILGDNGSGKSTLFNLIMGELKPDRGKIIFDKQINPKKDIGYIIQNPDYQLFMPTVEEEIMLRTKDRKWSRKLIEHFKIQDQLQRNPFGLSEGEKRKLGIICILSMQPKILLMDEPTVGLDDDSICDLIEILASYQKELTIVTISHDQRVIQRLASRIYCLD